MLYGSAGQYGIGQILVGKSDGRPIRAIVLDKAEDSGELLLMTLSEGRALEIGAEDAKSWTLDPPPEARWMEVSEGEDDPPFFAAYLPTLNDALAAAKVFSDRGEFRVEIFAASDEEQNQIAAG